MTIGFEQAFGLVGVGMLAGIGLFVWIANRVSRHYEKIDPSEGCLTTFFVTVMAFGCLLLLWLIFR